MNPNQAVEITEPTKTNPETGIGEKRPPSPRLEKLQEKFFSFSSEIRGAFAKLKGESPQVDLTPEQEEMDNLSKQLNILERNTGLALGLQNETLKKDLKAHFSDTPRVIEGMIGKGEKWDRSLAQTVMSLHDGVQRRNENKEPIPDTKEPSKIILVTATSAIPYAIAIKESWRTAYPNEQLPKFFFVDVSKNRFGLNDQSQPVLGSEEIEEIDLAQRGKLQEIAQKYDAFNNTAVFDEYKYQGKTLREVQRQLQLAGFDNVNYMHGNWGYQHPDEVITPQIRPVIRKGEKDSPYKPLAININEGSKNLVKDMRTIGREMGNTILKHVSPTIDNL